MAKISSYPENTAPAPEMFTPIEPVTHDQKYKTAIGNLSVIPFRNKMNKQWNEFDGGVNNQLSPFTPTAIGAGTFVPLAQVANHPGIWRISSGAGANTGHAVTLGGILAVLIGGGEIGEFIFRVPAPTNVVERLGFIDSVSAVAPVDGVSIVMAGTTLDGRTVSNSVQSITASNVTIAANTWYRGKIEVNNAATLVTFSLYDANSALLWTDTLSANIPIAAGRETGFGALAYKTTVTAADILDLDWMAYYNTKALVR